MSDTALVAGPGSALPGETPVLEVRNLVKHFPIYAGDVIRRRVGEVHAVCDVSFDLYPRSTLGLVGESGSGKSTTGRCLLRLHEPTSGSVALQGRGTCWPCARGRCESCGGNSRSSSRIPTPRSTPG